MNYEARLITLRRMRDEIETVIATRGLVPGAGPDPALSARIERWTQQVALAMKDIRSGQHLNALHYDRMRFARDRDARRSARDRFAGRDRNLATLDVLAVEISDALRRLHAQKGADKPSEAQAVEAIGKSLEKILKAVQGDGASALQTAFEQEQPTLTASIRQLERGAGGPTTVSGPIPVIDMFTLILAYFALLKTLRK